LFLCHPHVAGAPPKRLLPEEALAAGGGGRLRTAPAARLSEAPWPGLGFRGFDLENPRKNGDFMTMAMEKPRKNGDFMTMAMEKPRKNGDFMNMAMEDTMKIYHEHDIPCF